MKTIRIAITNAFISSEEQVELEKNIAEAVKDTPVTDFVFNEKGDLEVTFAPSEYVSETYIYNMCNLQIQYAIYKSGRQHARELDKHLFI